MEYEIELDGELTRDDLADIVGMNWVQGRAATLGHAGFGQEEAIRQAVDEFNELFPDGRLQVTFYPDEESDSESLPNLDDGEFDFGELD